MRDVLPVIVIIVVLSAASTWAARNRIRPARLVTFVALAAVSGGITALLYPHVARVRDVSWFVVAPLALASGIAACWFGFSALFGSLLLAVRRPRPDQPSIASRWTARIGLASSPRKRRLQNFGVTLGLLSWGVVSAHGIVNALTAGSMFCFLRFSDPVQVAGMISQEITFEESPGLFSLQIGIWILSGIGSLVWAFVRLARAKSL